MPLTLTPHTPGSLALTPTPSSALKLSFTLPAFIGPYPLSIAAAATGSLTLTPA